MYFKTYGELKLDQYGRPMVSGVDIQTVLKDISDNNADSNIFIEITVKVDSAQEEAHD